jgi:ribose 1,5-bisphosphokinase PhnN
MIVTVQAEMDTLKKTQEDLQRGRQKLDDMLARLDKEQVQSFNRLSMIIIIQSFEYDHNKLL